MEKIISKKIKIKFAFWKKYKKFFMFVIAILFLIAGFALGFKIYKANKNLQDLNTRRQRERNFCERLVLAEFGGEATEDLKEARINLCLRDQLARQIEYDDKTMDALVKNAEEKRIAEHRRKCEIGSEIFSSITDPNEREFEYKQWMRKCMGIYGESYNE